MNAQSIKKARSFYALSCITSPGGKHRGLAGSVAVLVSESLLMLIPSYMRPVMGQCKGDILKLQSLFKKPKCGVDHKIFDLFFKVGVYLISQIFEHL